MRRSQRDPKAGGFTLVELLVVIGIIALLISILLPALNKARAAASAATCLSNLRTMGQAWNIYMDEGKGNLPLYVWNNNPGLTGAVAAQYAWDNGWVGLLSQYKTNVSSLLCPTANEEIPFASQQGFGTSNNAWSGRWQGGTPVPIADVPTGAAPFINNSTIVQADGYRTGSYGMSRFMFAGNSPNMTPGGINWGYKISAVRFTDQVPVFFDCVWVDPQVPAQTGNTGVGATMITGPLNAGTVPPLPMKPGYTWPPTASAQVDLSGGNIASVATPDAYNDRWMIARHNNGINVCFVDGHAEYVDANTLPNLKWGPSWFQFTYSQCGVSIP